MRRRFMIILLIAAFAGLASAYAAFRLEKAPHAAPATNGSEDDTVLF